MADVGLRPGDAEATSGEGRGPDPNGRALRTPPASLRDRAGDARRPYFRRGSGPDKSTTLDHALVVVRRYGFGGALAHRFGWPRVRVRSRDAGAGGPQA